MHVYPLGSGWSLADDLKSEEWHAIDFDTPVIMCEFGAFRQFYPTVSDAVAIAVGLRKDVM